MLDAITSLAFSVHAAKGVYAVLLGSGVSRAAKIPTGWEITLELARKVAALEGEDCGTDPAGWYRTKFNSDPDYAQLLDGVAKTPAERQQLLRSYWEPSDGEREEGAKQPTTAHRAIAELVKRGYVRVILTTNFDRLMELALQDAGVQPTVLSSPDHIDGAMPLIHTPCTVIKVHGDYLDTRIRNTPQELATYPQQVDLLLDRVIDEFGLIICGWSAEWDEALRTAITRASSRRFSTYWAARGEPSEAAKALIQHRRAELIPIADADTFFFQLNEKVQALEDFDRPHPLSTDVAVASLRKYLSEPRYRIQLDDLIRRETAQVLKAISGADFDANVPLGAEALTQRVKAYEAVCETLFAMALTAGRWSTSEQAVVWADTLRELAQDRADAGITTWLSMRAYPGTLVLYAFGLGAVAAGNYAALSALLTTKVTRNQQADQRIIELCPPGMLTRRAGAVFRALPGMENRHAPLSDWLHDHLKPAVQRELHVSSGFTRLFDHLEIMIALAFAAGARVGDRFWVPPGAFGYRADNRRSILADLRASVAAQAESSPIISSGAFGASPAQFEQLTQSLEVFSAGLGWW